MDQADPPVCGGSESCVPHHGALNEGGGQPRTELRVMVEGKHCWTRKLLPEPKWCVKCQGYGHFAKECKATKDVCARCAGEHRTTDPDCGVAHGRTTRCANCNKDGHGAADRNCEVYKSKLAQLRARDPDSFVSSPPTTQRGGDGWGSRPDGRV